jgi:hypothetical protein
MPGLPLPLRFFRFGFLHGSACLQTNKRTDFIVRSNLAMHAKLTSHNRPIAPLDIMAVLAFSWFGPNWLVFCLFLMAPDRTH